MRNLAARAAMMAKSGELSARSYVQNGCLALWDGIENDGFGSHSSTTTQWKDCISGILYTGNFSSVETYGLYSDGSVGKNLIATNPLSISNTSFTIDVSFTTDNNEYNTYWVPFAFSDNYSASGRLQINTEGNLRVHPIYNAIVETIFTGITSIALKRGTISIVWDGTVIALYFNAVYKGSKNLSVIQYASMYGGGQICVFDRANYEGSFAFSERFAGTIHCNRIYNRALSASEVAANWAIDQQRFGFA